MIAPAEKDCLEASIAATERRIAEQNERIIADLMKGRDPVDAEARALKMRIALYRMQSRRRAFAGTESTRKEA
ncbi:MAG: hypothetical protein NVSMB26_04500 [Beijerinckiaceae bacterium]